MTALLSKSSYAESVGVTVKTVERWLAAGLVPEAQRQGGRWWFPAGTPRPSEDDVAAASSAATPGATSRDVAAPTAAGEVAAAQVPGPVVVGGTLEEFAAMAGCSPRGVRRLFEDMKANPGLPFYVGRYAPHGALHVVAMPRG